ncbi:hypothetical protein JCM10207_005737 [Rhodosporidiobolus poonsookiae]
MKALVLLEHKPVGVELSDYLARLRAEVRKRSQGSEAGRTADTAVEDLQTQHHELSNGSGGRREAGGGGAGREEQREGPPGSGIEPEPAPTSLDCNPVNAAPPPAVEAPALSLVLPPLPPQPNLPFILPSLQPAHPTSTISPTLLLDLIAACRAQFDACLDPTLTPDATIATFANLDPLLSWLIDRTAELPAPLETADELTEDETLSDSHSEERERVQRDLARRRKSQRGLRRGTTARRVLLDGRDADAAEAEPTRAHVETALAALLTTLVVSLLSNVPCLGCLSALFVRLAAAAPTCAFESIIPSLLSHVCDALDGSPLSLSSPKDSVGIDILLSLVHLVLSARPPSLHLLNHPPRSTALETAVDRLATTLASPDVEIALVAAEGGLEGRVLGVVEACWALLEAVGSGGEAESGSRGARRSAVEADL